MIRVKVRGGYEYFYRNTVYRSGSILEMEEGDYVQVAHLFDVVKEEPAPPKEEPKEEPKVVTESIVEPQQHRAIVKPVRMRKNK